MEYYKNFDLENIIYINDEGIECVEQWKDMPNFGGVYQVSDLGRVKSFAIHNGTKSRIIKQSKSKKGYLRIIVYKNKKRFNFQSHRIVAQIFIPNTLFLLEINHKKGNKTDNRACAIEWITHEDNIIHAVKHSLIQKGEKCHKAKLTEKQVLEIRDSNLSAKQLSEKYNVSKTTIWSTKRKEYWKHI